MMQKLWSIKTYAIKYGLIGVLNTAVQQVLYLIFLKLSCPYQLSQTASYIMALTLSFVLNSTLNYGVSMSWQLFKQFIFANIPAYLIQFFVLTVLVGGLGWHQKISLFLTLFLTIPLSFTLVSLGMFKKKKASSR